MVEGLPCGAENLYFHSNQQSSGLTAGTRYAIGHNLGSFRSVGGLCVRGTPGPISNPAVKPDSAYGTWRVTAWESRSLPMDLCLINARLAFIGPAGVGL